MATTVLHTDSAAAYVPVTRNMAGHFTVDHKAGIYATDKTNGTNKAENFFSQLKRSIDGTHHHVSVEHLPRYLAEFDYRFSSRKLTDEERMADLLTRVEGRFLTYKKVAVQALEIRRLSSGASADGSSCRFGLPTFVTVAKPLSLSVATRPCVPSTLISIESTIFPFHMTARMAV